MTLKRFILYPFEIIYSASRAILKNWFMTINKENMYISQTCVTVPIHQKTFGEYRNNSYKPFGFEGFFLRKFIKDEK